MTRYVHLLRITFLAYLFKRNNFEHKFHVNVIKKNFPHTFDT